MTLGQILFNELKDSARLMGLKSERVVTWNEMEPIFRAHYENASAKFMDLALQHTRKLIRENREKL